MPPSCRITARAPIRILDLGGWTDTWFSKRGLTFNVAVNEHCTECQIEPLALAQEQDDSAHCIELIVENYGDKYMLHIDPHRYGTASGSSGDDGGGGAGEGHDSLAKLMERHPLLGSCLTYFLVDKWLEEKGGTARPGVSCRICLFSSIPAGSSCGTSSSILVCLIAAMDKLCAMASRGDNRSLMTQMEVAQLAHHIEFDRLKMQCGIQDQIACAVGGINLIEMREFPFKDISLHRLHTRLSRRDQLELESRLMLVFLGDSHVSSQVHKMVIHKMEDNDEEKRRTLDELRTPPEMGRRAIARASDTGIDFTLLGQAMILNTTLQSRLHSELVSDEAWKLIEVAKKHGVLGYKVNGAGGFGGSITFLTDGSMTRKRALERDINASSDKWKIIPLTLSTHGVEVWQG